MMRRKTRRGISVILSLSMAFSASVFTGGITTDAAVENISGAVSVKQAAASAGGSSYGDVYEDDATGYLYKFYDDGTDDAGQKVEIVGYAGAGITPYADDDEDAGALIIPDTLDGSEVTSIGDEAFKGDKTITSVTISEGITSIGYSAFMNCTYLESVSIPSTITEWREESFDNNAFKNCKSLKKVELAEGLTILGQAAFYSCVGLEEVRIPSTIETFNNRVFYNCTALKTVDLPEGLTTMGYQAFSNTALAEVTIPSTIKSWGTLRSSGLMATVHDCSPFAGCKSLQKMVFTEGLTTLYQFSMGSIPLLKEVEVPGSVQNLEYAFKGATALEKVILHEGVTSIGGEAFASCTSLKEIYVPSTLVSVATSSAFTGVTAVDRVIFSPLGMPGTEKSLTLSLGSIKEIYILSDSLTTYQAQNLSATTTLYCPQDSTTYRTYQLGLTNTGFEDRLAAIPSTEAEAEAYQAVYDGEEHDAVTLSGIQEGDQVLYRLNEESVLREEMPKITDVDKYTVKVYVFRWGEEELLSAYSVLTVEAEIEEKVEATPTPSPSPIPGGTPTPTPAPGGNATPTPTPPASTTLKVGATFTTGKFKYKVTGAAAVAVQAPKSKTAKSLTIPATVKASGTTYKVTSIAANAYKNCKKLRKITIGKNVTSIGKNAFSNAKALKTITVKATKLKSVGKGALKGIHKKAVIKVPKAKLKAYKKLFKGKGQKKTVKIK